MSADELLQKFLKYYKLRNMSELANRLEVSQSTISNWRSRNSIGAIFEAINKHDSLFLHNLFRNFVVNNKIEGHQIDVGIDNSQEGSKHYHQSINIPEEVIDEIELLFKLAKKYRKEKEVIDNFDEFSYEQKKIIKNNDNDTE